MAVICPTVTAYDEYEYNEQLRVLKSFAKRIHIDMMDGDFTDAASPGIDHTWWPHELSADIHLMYQKPMEHLAKLVELKPNMVIVHNEAEVHHMHFAAELHKAGIKAGLAILKETPVEWAYQIMHSFDHVLIFSGTLGYHGGVADLNMLEKVRKVREQHPDAEIGWDGGVSDENAKQLADGGVDVLNVGGFIHDADNPAAVFGQLSKQIK
jgi:ribulose-phosphate 3-epimerase